MATAPMAPPPAPPAGAPPIPAQADANISDDSGMSQGFKVILMVAADGQMSVSVEEMGTGDAATAMAAPGDTSMGEDQGADAQPVASLPEAFKLIREIVQAGGEPVDAGASMGDMSAGYGMAP